ncbi:DUF2953 domain-containing protein [Jeotgalibacillus marinus]|uniref:DUF2953 domain-containing protein n=1 Tax=Jeotgalibacillus marinus TaxID=86667 RepID=A0ABV3PZZ7_9BACL
MTLVVIYCFFSKIRIYMLLIKTGNDDRIEFTIKLLHGLFSKKVSIPFMKREGLSLKYEEQQSNKKEEKTFTPNDLQHMKNNYDQFLNSVKNGKEHIRRIVKKSSVDRLTTDIRFGVGQADHTATLTALLWTVHGLIRTFLERTVTIACKPVHNVVPLYGQVVFKMTASCIVSIPLGHLMIIGIRLWIESGMSKQKRAGGIHGTSN